MARRIIYRVLPYLLIFIGVLTAIFALWIHPASKPQPSSRTSAPSAEKPAKSAIDAYTVAATLPRYLEIPSIDVPKSRVVGLGIGADNQIAVPNNLYDVGWYNASAKPGEAGAMFIYGHVSGWQANGIFFNLYKLQPGDSILVTRGDGTRYAFKVITSKRYPVASVDMKAALSPITSGQEGLNLMTCAGKLDQKTGEFSERLVVFASLVR